MKRVWLITLATALAAPATAPAYPGGTPAYVTDVAPFCASCHSSVSADQFVGVPEARVNAELAANKHLAKIQAAAENTPYAKLDDAQRAALLEGIRKLDAASSVELVTPEKIKPGSVFEVTVRATGGGGPVVGLALVDATLRWQARPAPSAGWHVLDKPAVVGPDGKPQTEFTDRRAPGLEPGTSYVNVTGIHADPMAGKFAQVSVTWRLRAPSQPGTYPLAAVFLYGTEKGSPHGAVDTLRGPQPIGGFTAASGRVRFSKLHQIRVE